MIHLAFKKAAAEPHNIFGQLIAKVTDSPYCHVEGWISGPIGAALCFSSREPHGTGWQTIDLSDAAMWDIVPLDLDQYEEIEASGFCEGADGKHYDGVGILGYAVRNPDIHDYSRVFCSEVWASIAKQCWNKDLSITPGVERHAWQISPGQLYELAQGWK